MMDMPYGGYDVPPFEVQAPGYPHPHQVRVWLPPSYHHTSASYPVLWVTDNLLEHAVSALLANQSAEAPELVVVAVGSPRGSSTMEFTLRRNYDFLPGRELLTYDESLFEQAGDGFAGGAPAFLSFLTGELRERISADYRCSGDHGLAGCSGGAMFTLFSLFTRPDAFQKYLVGSPAMGVDYVRLEEEHHAKHGDLAARVFLAAGGAELTSPGSAAIHVVSTMASVCERLVTRGYPDLEVEAAIYPGCTHTGVMPALFADGVRWLWRDQPKAFVAS